ncbi:MAG: CHRD domain-containing protein, partial [Pyrinomonadaceae bacterium]
MKKLNTRTSVLILIAVVAVGVAVVAAQNFGNSFRNRTIREEHLNGFEEAPSVSTRASGQFRATISNDESRISYELSYADMEAPLTQAHIHIGQPAVVGGIMLFLCTNVGGPDGTQPCPPSPATITGTLTANDIVTLAV